MNLNTILSSSPIIEVIVRNLYWRFHFVHRILSDVKKKQSKYRNKAVNKVNAETFPGILEAIKSFGVKEGDILIVHSSALKCTGLSPDAICKLLINLIGSEGTLAMPAIPLFREEAKGPDRIKNFEYMKQLKYDVKRTPPWTGFIPLALMQFDEAIRSQHPLNTMVAVGKYAKEMMRSNIDQHLSKACGIDSSWKFCADHHAKILFLDVDPAHCMTMIHVVEDSYKENGYAPGWYRERPFKIVDGQVEKDIVVSERDPKCAMYYAERTLQKDLMNAGVLKTKFVNEIQVSFCESAHLINFLREHKSQTYPYWIPFWRRFR